MIPPFAVDVIEEYQYYITVCPSEDGNEMALNFRVWRSVLSPEAVVYYACPQFTLVYKLMNKVYTCSAQASL